MDEFLTESDQWERVKTFSARMAWLWSSASCSVPVSCGDGPGGADHVTASLQRGGSALPGRAGRAGRNDKARAIELTRSSSRRTIQPHPTSTRRSSLWHECMSRAASSRRPLRRTRRCHAEFQRRAAPARGAGTTRACAACPGKADDALKTLGTGEPAALTAGYQEIRGDALLQKGDRKWRACRLSPWRSPRWNPASPTLVCCSSAITDLAAEEPTQESAAPAPKGTCSMMTRLLSTPGGHRSARRAQRLRQGKRGRSTGRAGRYETPNPD